MIPLFGGIMLLKNLQRKGCPVSQILDNMLDAIPPNKTALFKAKVLSCDTLNSAQVSFIKHFQGVNVKNMRKDEIKRLYVKSTITEFLRVFMEKYIAF